MALLKDGVWKGDGAEECLDLLVTEVTSHARSLVPV